MTVEKIKALLDACYQAKRARQLLPALPDAAGQIGIGHIGPRFLCGLHDFRCSEDSIAKNLL